MSAVCGQRRRLTCSGTASLASSRYVCVVDTFVYVRPRLFGIGYRMLGSAAEAEDIVQDVWLRWQTTNRSLVRDAAAFLATTTTRLAINVMHSARSRRNIRRALAAGTRRHERQPWVGSGARRGSGGGGPAIAGEAVAHGTGRVHPSRGVRIRIPRHRGHPSAPRSQRAATRDPRPPACGQWSENACECDRAETSSRSFHCRGRKWRRRRAPGDSWRRTSTRVTRQPVEIARTNLVESDQHAKGHRL